MFAAGAHHALEGLGVDGFVLFQVGDEALFEIVELVSVSIDE